MTVINKMVPVHPGEILKEEMSERDISANALAHALSVPTNRITAILHGQRRVTADTARLLAGYFETSPEFWLNLQKTWDLLQAEFRSKNQDLIKFMPSTGSTIGGSYRDKKPLISEALSDMQLALRGFGLRTEGLHEVENIAQKLGAFARLSSVFVRKLVLGDKGNRETRLLDETVLDSLDLRFQPLRKIPKTRRRAIMTGFGVGGGFMEITNVDEPNSKPTRVLLVAPQDVAIDVEWPLPGMADWIDNPVPKNPWMLSPDQLFDTSSTESLTCDNWLAQQVVVFNKKAVSLKEIFNATVHPEGAHSINLGRLTNAEGQKRKFFVSRPEIHLLNNIGLFGIRYSHAIVIEAALYLYKNLMAEESIRRPDGGLYLVKSGFACSNEQANSSRPDWLRFDGSMTMVFGEETKLIKHSIKPAG